MIRYGPVVSLGLFKTDNSTINYIQREVLFRGKVKKTGKWVWGSLIQNGEYDYAIYDCNEHRDYNGEEVVEETIGQYTNLNDRKGHRIFEGDIVKFHYFFQSLGDGLGVQESEHELVGKVVWGSYGWGIDAISGQHWEGYTGYDKGEGGSSFMELHELNPGSPHEESFDVIGNIHEHPHLLNPLKGERINTMNNQFDPNEQNAEGKQANAEATAEQATTTEATENAEQAAGQDSEEGSTEG